MSITGIPLAPAAPPAEASGADQATVAPRTTAVYREPVPAKLQAVAAAAGQAPTVRWTMKDDDGNAVDLTACRVPAVGADPTPGTAAWVDASVPVAFRAREYTAGPTTVAAAAWAVDPAAGLVAATLDLGALGGPGIYHAEFAVLAADGVTPLFLNRFLLAVERSLFDPTGGTDRGPLTRAEIRLHLHDSGAAESRLLDAVEFDDAEIAACIARPVDYWNESDPPLGDAYTTRSFPFRFLWLEGTIACLCELAASFYRRNHLPYQAGGVTVDDLAKAPDYDRAAQMRWQKFEQLVRRRKIAFNLEAGWGSVASPYRAPGTWGGRDY